MNINLKLFFGTLILLCNCLFGYSMYNKIQITKEHLVLFTDMAFILFRVSKIYA